MDTFRPTVLLGLLFFELWSTASGQPTLTKPVDVLIRAMDETGVPLAAVRIMLAQPSGEIEAQGETDTTGRLTLGRIPEGTYGVQAAKGGFYPVHKEQVVDSNARDPVELKSS
ncbi:MAG: carboxypeptidase-like regulatory domain-containing protein [Acidobacteriota bacterium]